MNTVRTYYVSLTEDLNGAYLEFKADSENAVRMYLERKYLEDRRWKMPWCAVYEYLPEPRSSREQVVIKAACGTLYEEDYQRMLEHEGRTR